MISDSYLLEIKIASENPDKVIAELHNCHPALGGFVRKRYDDGTLRLWGFMGLQRDESPAKMHRRIAGCLQGGDPAAKITTRWRWVRWEHEFTSRGASRKAAEFQSPRVRRTNTSI